MGELEASHLQRKQQLPAHPVCFLPTWSCSPIPPPQHPLSLALPSTTPRRPRRMWTQVFCSVGATDKGPLTQSASSNGFQAHAPASLHRPLPPQAPASTGPVKTLSLASPL